MGLLLLGIVVSVLSYYPSVDHYRQKVTSKA